MGGGEGASFIHWHHGNNGSRCHTVIWGGGEGASFIHWHHGNNGSRCHTVICGGRGGGELHSLASRK